MTLPVIPFPCFALLRLAVFTTLHNSMREKIKNHSVETVSGVSHESSVKVVTYVKGKTGSKVKANLKYIRTTPDLQFKEFSLLNKTRPRMDNKWIEKTT